MRFWAGETVRFILPAIPGGACAGAAEARFRVVSGQTDDLGRIPVLSAGRYYLMYEFHLEHVG